jgi:hypothetical protein
MLSIASHVPSRFGIPDLSPYVASYLKAFASSPLQSKSIVSALSLSKQLVFKGILLFLFLSPTKLRI